MDIRNAYDYLQSEYNRLNVKRKNTIKDYNDFFEEIKDRYGSGQKYL